MLSDGLLTVSAELLADGNFTDNDGFDRYVLMVAAVGSLYLGDFLHHFHTRCNFAEHRIAVALRGFVFEVQKLIVGGVDEKLAGSGIGIAGTRHGDGANSVLQAVVGFVANGFVGGFLYHVGCESAALNHEAVDDAVEDGVVVKAFAGVADEVGDGFRRFGFIQRQADIAHIGFDNGACFGLSGERCGEYEGAQSQFAEYFHERVSCECKTGIIAVFYVKAIIGNVKKPLFEAV